MRKEGRGGGRKGGRVWKGYKEVRKRRVQGRITARDAGMYREKWRIEGRGIRERMLEGCRDGGSQMGEYEKGRSTRDSIWQGCKL